MRGEDFIERFRELETAGRLTDRDIEETCAAIAGEIAPSREAVRALCDVATTTDLRRRAFGQRAIFTSIVERLGDSFEPRDVDTYDRMFAQIIDDCRRRPGGGEVHRMLDRFRIHNEADLLRRKQRIAAPKRFAPTPQSAAAIKRVFVLSRVTMGADVAVTSVLMNGLASAFPNAAIVLAAPPPIADLYGSWAPFRSLDTPYARRGGLLDRLDSWTDLVRMLDHECQDLDSSEYLVVDPDSRLTQLGLLPVTDDDRYFFFESRSYRNSGKTRLAELAGEWQRETFGGDSAPHPFVDLASRDALLGRRAAGWLRPDKTKRIVAFNFGVGANETKRLTLEFEAALTLGAFAKGYAVILDKGVGAECDRANQIVAGWRAAGRRVVEFDDSNAYSEAANFSATPADAVTWQGGPGPFAGLIAAADLYAGYDSAFQHIAAALGRPVIDMFAHQNNARFIERWTPYSGQPGATVQTAQLDAATPTATTVSQILSLMP